MIQFPSRRAVGRARREAAVRLQLRVDLVEDRLRLPRVAARRDHEVVGVDAGRPHVEDDDVLGQLLGGESGDSACLFERGQRPQCSRGPQTSIVAVEAVLLDVRGDFRRHEAVDRLAARDARTDLRAGDVVRLELEASRCGRSPPRARSRGGSRRRAARARARARAPSRSAKSASWSAPMRKIGSSYRASSSASTVKRCRSSSTVAPSRREREPRHREPVLRGSVRALVACVRDHGHVQVVDPEPPHRRLGERDVAVVRRVEAAAEDAGHCHSNASSPTSTSCPFRTPAAFSAASSSSPAGASPDDAEAAVGAVDPVGAARRLRPVEPELRQLGLVRLGRGTDEREQRALQLARCPRPSRPRRRTRRRCGDRRARRRAASRAGRSC